MSEGPELLSILIVSYNTRDLLGRCLESLRQRPANIPHEVIVIDNQSTDGSAEMVARDYPQCHLIHTRSNDGYGVAINLGMRDAKGTWLLFLNPDIEVRGDAIDTLLEAARARPRAGVIGPRLVLSDGKCQPSARRFSSPLLLLLETTRLHLLLPPALRARIFLGTYFAQDRTLNVPWVSGAAHLIPRSVWEEVGPLTEETFCGSDDYDYCYRVRQHGYQVWICSEAGMIHHCSVAVRGRWTTWEVDQLAIHNFFVIYESHWPTWKVRALALVEILACILENARHSIWPRTEQGAPGTLYRDRLIRRLVLMWNLLTGRQRPIRRFQPGGWGDLTRRRTD